MNNDLKKEFDKHGNLGGFIKVTDSPISSLTSEQKVVLNRKGNTLLNQGKVLEARRLFITTGYSDGLSRVADVSLQNKNELDALKLYWLAHNKRKAEPLIKKLADVISLIIEEE